MITDLQKRSVQAIVNIFETGQALGDYGKVTLLSGDSGHLTYGRSQTTLASGNLYLLIKAYCAAPDAALADGLSPFLARLEDIDLSLDRDMAFRTLLEEAGSDLVMQDVQDRFFDRVYWEPAVKSAAFIDSKTPLGQAAIYDSRIHGSWHRIRDRTIGLHKTLAEVGEKPWIERYVKVRRDWLANHSNTLLRKTVYRMDALQDLIDGNRWELALPLTVRGVEISEAVLSGSPLRASAEVAEARLLRLRQPFMAGEDVRDVQTALAAKGLDVEVDSVFGPGTRAAVAKFQEAEGLTPDGMAGPATRARLGID